MLDMYCIKYGHRLEQKRADCFSMPVVFVKAEGVVDVLQLSQVHSGAQMSWAGGSFV